VSIAGPGRFTRAAIHSEAGEVEVRLSAKGDWQVRIRAADDPDWRLVCSGDLEGGQIAPQVEPQRPIRLGPITLDRAARRVLVDGAELRLSAREFDLLTTLASQPNRVFSKQELLQAWGYRTGCRTRTLSCHASRLRNKLLQAGAEGLIINFRGIGYKLWDGIELAPAEPQRAA
jgi:DNA-binding response OmpR family regulator